MSKITVEAQTIFETELWEAGTGTLVLTFGKKLKEFYNYKKGDRLQIAVLNHTCASEQSAGDCKSRGKNVVEEDGSAKPETSEKGVSKSSERKPDATAPDKSTNQSPKTKRKFKVT